MRGHERVAGLVGGLSQRQSLSLRLLQRLLHRRPIRRSCLPLRRARGTQRGLLGRGKAAQVLQLATMPNLRRVGFEPVCRYDNVGVAGLVFGRSQREPLHLRLLQHLFPGCCCRPLRSRPPLRRLRDTQRGLLGGGKAA
eukprot:scaffold45699_cov75-Phaeocystis_antarctica.AAC.3